jgi:hypothetical protein
MGKESALGYDPLGWVKAVKDNKKPSSDNQAGKNVPENNPPLPRQQPSIHSNADKPLERVSQSTNNAGSSTRGVPPLKPKVVIGRMYEKPVPEKPKSVQVAESTLPETGQVVKSPISVATYPQQVRRIETEINRPVSTSGDRFLTYIIIAYTTFLLILGCIVYSNLSRRMGRMEAKVLALQKALLVQEQ